jgi:hypothetical protein
MFTRRVSAPNSDERLELSFAIHFAEEQLTQQEETERGLGPYQRIPRAVDPPSASELKAALQNQADLADIAGRTLDSWLGLQNLNSRLETAHPIYTGYLLDYATGRYVWVHTSRHVYTNAGRKEYCTPGSMLVSTFRRRHCRDPCPHAR